VILKEFLADLPAGRQVTADFSRIHADYSSPLTVF